MHDVLFDDDEKGAVIIRSNGLATRAGFLDDAEAVEKINLYKLRELDEYEEAAIAR
ncbi:MAG: hypothetical protein LBU32_24055 [Clostridiales bacterium]|nr:hypothetical protein [Clostridiales bacterium]